MQQRVNICKPFGYCILYLFHGKQCICYLDKTNFSSYVLTSQLHHLTTAYKNEYKYHIPRFRKPTLLHHKHYVPQLIADVKKGVKPI